MRPVHLPRQLRRVLRWPERGLVAVVEFVLRWALRLGLPVAGAAAMLHTFPYRATVEGVPFRVEGSLFRRSFFSADTTFGNWEFPHVDRLPVGVHVTPVDVNLLQLAREATGDTPAYVERLQAGFSDQLPAIAIWLVGELLLGVLIGLLLAASVNMSVRYLRGLPRRRSETRIRLRQLGAAAVVLVVIAGYGVATFHRDWPKRSRVTGTLAAAQLLPSELQRYYQQSKAFDVVNAVVGIQAALQTRYQQQNAPPTAFPIMFVSDLHLAAVYPLLQQYAVEYGVKLIVNTGDETEFGRRAELTPAYRTAMSALTRTVPMLWVGGNHDSPEVAAVMRTIPGVTVLGGKTARPDGTIAVSAGVVDAFGLTIAGLPDPRIYGGPGPFGSDSSSVTDPLNRDAVDAALAGVGGRFDIAATHESVAADRIRHDLPDAVRQTNSGHVHQQNASGDLQHGTAIDLVEGSSGAGGLDNINRSRDGVPLPRPPIEFSIESVAGDCQFTRVQRFQITASTVADPADVTAQRYGDDATVSTVYFRPQELASGRTCSTALGAGPVRPLVPGTVVGPPSPAPRPSGQALPPPSGSPALRPSGTPTPVRP
ncbi:MAG: hypothetical protein QOC98_3061 [Frankiaceae bacterium]|nr:hypothetical protein [Frankiaceae bacterium]